MPYGPLGSGFPIEKLNVITVQHWTMSGGLQALASAPGLRNIQGTGPDKHLCRTVVLKTRSPNIK